MIKRRFLFIGILLGAGIIISSFFCVSKYRPILAQSSIIENEEVRQLNQEIQAKKDQLKKNQNKQDAYARAIAQKQAEKATLKNQLDILNNRIAKFELDIEDTQIDIDRINLEIKKTNAQIEEKKQEIDKEKAQIATAMRLIYKQDRASTLEILLLNNSFSEFINQTKYLEDINREVGQSLDALKAYESELENEKLTLQTKNKEAQKLKSDLTDQKKALDAEKEDKGYILDQTNMSERTYQRLLAQAKAEQLQAESDISSIEKTVREKLSKISTNKLEFNDNGLAWPVPKNTITAYFHDPDYPFKYVFEHPAIDIKSPQGSPLRAAASGYVAKVKDGGARGYSYIMLIHGDGLATVYGHVSASYVEEDEYVTQGQIIGLTGGLPGTHGAGPLTTGPHLHFEVRLNGIPVDPLDYLP